MNCVIIDYGMGNLRSIQHKLRKIGTDAAISSIPSEVSGADVLILPGIGHFAKGMQNLREYGLLPVLHKKVSEEKTPIIGICLGMQLFTRRSDEGNAEGLGWIDAVTKKFSFNHQEPLLRVPHIGWNTISATRHSQLLEGVAPGQRFYFVHSYYVVCNQLEDVLTTTQYGVDFVSSVQKGNMFGTQFHPEKSHPEGMCVLRNFIEGAKAWRDRGGK